MGHLCGSTCKRKTGQPCRTCRTSGGARIVQLDARGKPVNPPNGQYRQATPHEKGAAADLYLDSVSYRRTAENITLGGIRIRLPLTNGLGIYRKGQIACYAR